MRDRETRESFMSRVEERCGRPLGRIPFVGLRPSTTAMRPEWSGLIAVSFDERIEVCWTSPGGDRWTVWSAWCRDDEEAVYCHTVWSRVTELSFWVAAAATCGDVVRPSVLRRIASIQEEIGWGEREGEITGSARE